MRLVEVRPLEGPNVYRLEPTLKLEVVVGRRRTWYGERSPGPHASVRLGRPVRPADAPPPVAAIAAWAARLHELAGITDWLGGHRLPVAIHRTSEPGHWVVAWPWRERERAEAVAQHAFRFGERGMEARGARGGPGSGAGRAVTRAVERIRAAGTTPPPWITDDQRRMPVVAISGTNGKSTTTRMITHILHLAGRHVGTTTSDGVLLDERLVEPGDYTGPSGARSVLERDDVDVAVLETARGGLVLRGVGYESNDASVLTNVSADHLDLHGLHTLPELAEVKSVICRMTRPDGLVVLNAEDGLVAAVARTVRAPVCFFALSGRQPLLRRHVASGGRALVLDEGWLVELEGTERRPILPAADAPSTMLGLARHNIANALAAAGGARGVGATIEEVAAGLRDFRPSADLAPGRLNLYRSGERIVIVDFAHNEAGLDVLLDVAEGIAGPKGARRMPIVTIVGTAGDRPDDSLRGIGRIAGSRGDHVAIKQTVRYLRGRTAESMVGELLAGVASGGGPRRAEIPVYDDEAGSLRAELCDEARPAGAPERRAVVLIMCQADRGSVFGVLDELRAQPVERPEELAELVAAPSA